MLVVGAGFVALSTIVLGTPDPPSWTKLVGTVLGCGGLAVVALALIGGGLRGIGAARDRRIADRDAAPGSVVFGAYVLDEARTILAGFQADGPIVRRLPLTATFEVASGGLTVWDGPVARPRVRARLPWSEVARVEADRVRVGAFRTRTLRMTLADARVLYLQPVGSGVLDMYAMSAGDLDVLIGWLIDRLAGRSPASHPRS